MSGAGHSTQVAGPASRSVNMPGHALAGELSSSGEEKVFARAFWRPAGLCVFEERRVKAGGKSVCLWVGGFHVANFCKTRRRFEAYMYETRRRFEKVLSKVFFPSVLSSSLSSTCPIHDQTQQGKRSEVPKILQTDGTLNSFPLHLPPPP